MQCQKGKDALVALNPENFEKFEAEFNAAAPQAADASRIGRYAMKTDSSPTLATGTLDRNETPAREIALWRIYLLRAGYLLIG